MPSRLYNRVRVSTATTGTGTITLGAAISNAYFTFAEAGVADAATVSYVIEDGLDVEFGVGTYTSSNTTLSRDTVTASKINGVAGTSKIDLSGSAVVFISALSADIARGPTSATDNAISRFDGTDGRVLQNSNVLVTDDGEVSIGGPHASGLTGADIYLSVQNPSHNPGGALLVGDYDTGSGGSNRNVYASLDNFNNDGYGEGFSAQYARGTRSSKAIVQANDTIAGHIWYGYDGNSYVAAASFYGAVDGTPGDGDMPGRIGFATTLDGAASPTDAMTIKADHAVGIGTSSPDRRLHVEQDSAATNTVTQVHRLTSTSSGSPAAGIGVGMEFEAETAVGNNEVGATIEATTTDVTSTSEDFDLVFKIMRAGAAASEGLRVTTDWPYFTDSAGNKMYVPKTTRLGSQHSISSATATEVTGLQQTLVAGTYTFEYYLLCQAAATATGLAFGVNYTGTATSFVAILTWPDTGVTAALGAVDDAANAATGQVIAHAVTRTESTSTPNLSTGTTGVATQNVNLLCKISGIIVVSDGGDLELWHGSETANATSVEVGSSLVVTRTA